MTKVSTWLLAILLAPLMTACAMSGPKFDEVVKTLPALTPDAGRIYFWLS